MLRDERADDLAVTTKTTPTDVVTVMDRRAERLIVESLLAVRPGDGVLGEEGGERPGSSGVRWVVDPIDGTVNYLYRFPYWAVSIAAESGGEAVAGAVHAPLTGETFSAVRGGGAWLGPVGTGQRLRCTSGVPLSQALVATGFGYDARRRARQAEVAAAVLPRVRDIRRAGTASLDLCAVASGRVDGYWERGLQPWDLAAGGLVAREAGAVVAGLDGRPAGEDLVLAAGPELFGPLHDLLAGERADRDG